MSSRRGLPWHPHFFILHTLPAIRGGAFPTADDLRGQAGRVTAAPPALSAYCGAARLRRRSPPVKRPALAAQKLGWQVKTPGTAAHVVKAWLAVASTFLYAPHAARYSRRRVPNCRRFTQPGWPRYGCAARLPMSHPLLAARICRKPPPKPSGSRKAHLLKQKAP